MKKPCYFLFTFSFLLLFSQEKLDVFKVARSGTLEEISKIYSENKTAIDSVNAMTFTPLILACYRNNNPVAEFLITHVQNLNFISDNGTALMASVYQKNKELTQILIDNKANINLTDKNGQTALMLSVIIQSKEMIQILLKNNADRKIQDSNGKTAFELAIETQNQEIINALKQ